MFFFSKVLTMSFLHRITTAVTSNDFTVLINGLLDAEIKKVTDECAKNPTDQKKVVTPDLKVIKALYLLRSGIER